jgi:uncharacterized protein YydD (DUF2326 family)
MRLHKVYSNQPDTFQSVTFNRGLSAVLAEIRIPANRDRDTHNLGKTTLSQIIDFLLLKGKSQSFFLTRHADRFAEFTFYLELELGLGRYLTIQRSALTATKVSFKSHGAADQDFTTLPPGEWDHFAVPFARAKQLLDGLLGIEALRPWDFRKEMGYLLRSQDDYRDVFQLDKHRGKHVEWKPPLGQVLGFDSHAMEQLYLKRNESEALNQSVRALESQLVSLDQDLSTTEGLLVLMSDDIRRREALLDEFNFNRDDQAATAELVDEIDVRIATLNEERYALSQIASKIDTSIQEHELLFDPDDAQRLFVEAGVLFGGQLKRDFDQLISFNRAITEERRTSLLEERADVTDRLAAIEADLSEQSGQRANLLKFITDRSALDKYKKVSAELVKLRADLAVLLRQRDNLTALKDLRADARAAEEEYARLQTRVEENVSHVNRDPESKFSTIRRYFNEIVEEVLDSHAILVSAINVEGNIEFRAEIVDASGSATSRDRGNSYRKLLCIAFDLAVLRAHLQETFPRFVYHDGAFESLDNRKKRNLLNVLRRYASYGLQPIITLIDSDIPTGSLGDDFLRTDEIVLRLHDLGAPGRLFRMDPW